MKKEVGLDTLFPSVRPSGPWFVGSDCGHR